MTLVGICFVCGGYFDGGVVVNVGDDDCVCYAHASELPAVYVPAEPKAGEQ